MLSPQEYQERCDEYFSREDDIRERYHREAEDMRQEDLNQELWEREEQAQADKAGLALEAWREAERENWDARLAAQAGSKTR